MLVASAVAFTTGPAEHRPLVEQVRSTLEMRNEALPEALAVLLVP